jgi:hypothetical protein
MMTNSSSSINCNPTVTQWPRDATTYTIGHERGTSVLQRFIVHDKMPLFIISHLVVCPSNN